jgi:pyruvate dehydrogenase E2 component (dihydrolipoamide acetyltransferase)
MATEFIMPKLGLTMESGTIDSWLVADGATVEAGMAVASIETDKVVTDIESSGSGILRLVGQPGVSYDCGQLIGWICAPGEEPPTNRPGGGAQLAPSASSPTPGTSVAAAGPSLMATAQTTSGRLLASPNARRTASLLNVTLARVAGTGPDGRIVSEDVERAAASGITLAAAQPPTTTIPVPRTSPVPHTSAPGVPGAWGTVQRATFAAVQLSQMLGLDPNEVPTASLDGMVTREDVAEHARSLIARGRQSVATPVSAVAAPPTVPSAPKDAAVGAGLSPMRRVIAQRMAESIHSMAQLTLTLDVDMDVVVTDRTRRKSASAASGVPGYTDYVIKACAHALRLHPYVNTSMTETGIVAHPEVHVGMAVAVDGGLLVPVVRFADGLTLDQLAADTSRLATAARANRLGLHEMEGGTFSVTALGMFGVDTFTPIINPPNAAILGVGRIRTDTAWTDGVPSPVSRMLLSLTWDHRVFDGAPAAEFAGTIKRILEDSSFWSTN